MDDTLPTERFRYEVVPRWGRLPTGWSFVEVAGVAIDSQGRIFVFNRGEHPVVIFDGGGEFLSSWGEGQFLRPHGITITADDSIYLTDDLDHAVRRYTADGELLSVLGSRGRPSDTGLEDFDYRTIKRAGPPFNHPTNLAISSAGDLFVTDGYGNARVHRFSADGDLVLSWGRPGGGPGEFRIPHGVAIDGHDRIFVADRENSRVQIFSPEGEFIAEWGDVLRPTQVFIDPAENVFVTELGGRAGLWPWMSPDPEAAGGRVSVFDRDGSLQARWGGSGDPCAPGGFFAPHDIVVETEGNLYVGEVNWSAGGKRGIIPADCPCLRKFVRVR